MKTTKGFKGQSAMEYLMTYGWAILIIAIVLAALFSLGVFGGGLGLPNACVAQSGFSCSSPVYGHATGNILVTIGQNTGSNWQAAANVIFANTTTLSTITGGTWPTVPGSNTVTGTWYSGSVQSVNIPVSSTSTAIGAGVSGQIWARYQTVAAGTLYFTEVAVVTAKAV